MDDLDLNINHLTNVYRRITRIPIQKSATLLKINNLWKICVYYSSIDLDSGENCVQKKYFEIESSGCDVKVGRNTELSDASNELMVAYSKSYQLKAIIKKCSKQKLYIELWEENRKLKSLSSDYLEQIHGTICANDSFSAIEWSPNECCLLYIAEKKETQSSSFFKENDDKTEYVQRGNEFLYKEDWGEDLNGISHPCIYVVNVRKNFNIQVIEMNDFSLGSAFWINENTVGFIAWKETPYRLGLSYCSDRESFLYCVDLLDPKLEPRLLYGCDVEECIRFPRLSPDGDYVLFLSNPLRFNCEASKLMKYSLKDKRIEVIIDVTDTTFKPLYLPFGLAKSCFIDNDNVILDCVRNCQRIILRVNLSSKNCQELAFPLSSASVLDIKDNIFVSLCSAPNAFPVVYVAKIDSVETDPQYIKVDETFEHKIKDIQFKCDEIEINEGDTKLTLHTILIAAKNQGSNSLLPTIVLGHGGPHSSFMRNYLQNIHFFADIGFNTLLVNYRGSTGINEQHIRSIRGSIGDGDIRDIITCIEYYYNKGDIDKNNLLLLGWSHSGFQALHLCGQYPNFGFKACVVINPVVDASTIMEATDTPDWCWVKSLGGEKAFSFKSVVNSEVLQTMFNKSPIKYVNGSRTPTLFLLGKYDRRCPLSQGLKYYKALKARGIDVKCCVYDDNHLLDKIAVKSDAAINTALWFLRYKNN